VGLVHHLPTPDKPDRASRARSSPIQLLLPLLGLVGALRSAGGVPTAGVVVPLFSYVLPLLAAATSALSSPLLERVPARIRLPILLIASSPLLPILPSFILPVPVVEPRLRFFAHHASPSLPTPLLHAASPLTIPSQLSPLFTLTIKETSFAGETRALLALRHLACVAVHREIAYSSSRRTVEASVRGVRVFWPCFCTPYSLESPCLSALSFNRHHGTWKVSLRVQSFRCHRPSKTGHPHRDSWAALWYDANCGLHVGYVQMYFVQPCGGIHARNM